MSFIEKAKNRILNLVGQALLTVVDDTKQIQLITIKTSNGDDTIERLQNYGLSSNPSTGEVIYCCLNGNPDNAIAIVCDNGAFRPLNLNSGEVCLYSQFLQKVLLDKNGDIQTTQNNFLVGNGIDYVALSSKVDALWQKFYTVMSTWVPVAQDGGTALQTAFKAAFGSGPESTASSNLKAD